MADRTIVENANELRLLVIVAPMFLVSGPDLIIAAGKAGVIGAFPAPNSRTIKDLAAWLPRIAGELKTAGREGMWAINMIVHLTYERFHAEMDLVCEHRSHIAITALGSSKLALEQVHGYGGEVLRRGDAPAGAQGCGCGRGPRLFVSAIRLLPSSKLRIGCEFLGAGITKIGRS